MKNSCTDYRDKLIDQWDSTGEIDPSLRETVHVQQCDDCQNFLEEFEAFSLTLTEINSSPVPLNTAKMRTNVWQKIDNRTTQSEWWQQILRPVVLAPAMAILIAVSIYWLWPAGGESPEQRLDPKVMYSYAVDVLEPSEFPESAIEVVAQNEFDESIRKYMLEQENYSVIQDIYESEDEWENVMTELTTMQL